MELTVGIKGHDEVVVDMSNVASAVGSGALDVFSTPSMIACMERAALSSVMPYMDEGFSTVGIGLEVQHLAATPLGMKVWAESEVTAVDGKRIELNVTAYDEKGKIGEGTHKRFIVTSQRFLDKTYSKL